MSEKIRVKVVNAGGANLQLRYTDPVSGKVLTTTKYTDPSTGEVQRTGKNRKIARKYATLLEADLNAGRTGSGQSMTWKSFRDRYEMEVLPTLSQSVQTKVNTVFNLIEKQFPRVANGKLSFLDSSVISRYQAELRSQKKAEGTIVNYLATIRSALSWACRQKLIRAIPDIDFPRYSKDGGRSINAEEFDRMLLKIEAALVKAKIRRPNDAKQIESWRRIMVGLWLSGLRLEEAVKLSWDADEGFAIDLSGKHPRFKIRAEAQKGRRDELAPITPDFAQFLLETPAKERKGRVFKPLAIKGVACKEVVGKILCNAGRLAGIKVFTDNKTKKVKYASSRSLRKSFCTRWATRVFPPVLKRLARHANISTTMSHYVTLDADDLADSLWAQEEKNQGRGYESGYFPKNDMPDENHLSPYTSED